MLRIELCQGRYQERLTFSSGMPAIDASGVNTRPPHCVLLQVLLLCPRLYLAAPISGHCKEQVGVLIQQPGI